jgi:hypothetical protein
MTKKRVIDVEAETLPELPGKRELLEERADAPIMPVMPPILEILNNLGAVAGIEARAMVKDAQEGKRLSTDGSLKGRNLTVMLQTAQEIRAKAVSDSPLDEIPQDELEALYEEVSSELERRKRV